MNYLKKVEQDEMKKIVKSVQINKYYDELRFNRTIFFTFKIRLPNKIGQQRQLIRQLDTKNSTCSCHDNSKTIYTIYLKYVHKYFDPLRSNYGMEMKRSTKKN